MDNNLLLAKKALKLGFDCYQRSDFANAEILFQKVLQIEPKSFDAHHFLGILRLRAEQFSNALPFLKNAVVLRPDDGDANHHLALTLKGLNDVEKALYFFAKALKHKPNLAAAYLGQADVLSQIGRYEEAIQSYQSALKYNAGLIKAHNNLGTVYRKKGCLHDAIESYRAAVNLDPERLDIRSNLLMCMASSEKIDPSEYLEEAISFGKHARATAAPYQSWPSLKMCETKKLKIGFVSGDLRQHPAAEFIKSFIGKFDSSLIDLVAFSTTSKEDETSLMLKQYFLDWFVIESLTDQAAAELVFKNQIDILIDLSGHTAGNRLPLFVWKAAPIQISWIGFFASTGMQEIDYLLPNTALSPPEYEAHYVEKPWIISSAACLAVPEHIAEVNQLPAQKNGHVTFGSFHSLAKISDQVIQTWCRILLELPGSKLFFKCKELIDSGFRERLLEKCSDFGVEADRIEMEGSSPIDEYFKSFRSIDIGLDPFPYNSGTVGYHSLLMGVPYVSLKGDRILSRIGYSNLTQVGLGDLTADTLDEYVDKAVSLAKDIEHLGQIREGLRDKALKSGLFDGDKMANELQTVFREMWKLFLEKGN
ncbi:tetratricopeptide repeat protein [Neptuniibacter sp.]|uniref:O-linked N-acetylglucosamine transferase, SPINDLY family protein n=1 Tax=Neptuniibacter sp. TaxID=1962643 RepID=UPI003B5B173D